MATGISIPVRFSQGRCALAFGEDQTKKKLMLAFGDGSSFNPFNSDVGLSDPTFRLDGSALRAEIRQQVKRHFSRFERDHVARLETLRFDGETGDGEIGMTIVYIDLRADRRDEIAIKVAGGR